MATDFVFNVPPTRSFVAPAACRKAKNAVAMARVTVTRVRIAAGARAAPKAFSVCRMVTTLSVKAVATRDRPPAESSTASAVQPCLLWV